MQTLKALQAFEPGSPSCSLPLRELGESDRPARGPSCTFGEELPLHRDPLGSKPLPLPMSLKAAPYYDDGTTTTTPPAPRRERAVAGSRFVQLGHEELRESLDGARITRPPDFLVRSCR